MSYLSNPQQLLAFALAGLLVLPAPTPLAAQSMNVVDLSMTIGKSLVIDYPVDIGRISTSAPEVVDAVPATAKEFLLHGKGHGSATVVVWAKTGARTMYNVTVEHNLEPVRKLLSETFPNEDIRVQSGRDSISLIGRVSTKEVADRALAIATPLAKTVVTNLQIAPQPVEQQIILRVKFAELNRTAGMQFGVNLFSTGATGTIGALTTGQYTAPATNAIRGTNNTTNPVAQVFNVVDALNVFAFRPDLNLGAVIRALQNQDILQILAEPNLTTMNGKEASFLAGGEFPVPILQGGGNAGAVTVQFREYGIRLSFNPQITANGTIKMYVKPEVSTIDLSNSVSLSGFTIPALATRRMETNVELKEGQSFMIAGLLDDRSTEQMSKIPGLSSIPILGQLFKSRLERKSKTELIVIVTPEIVKPYDPAQKLPLPEFPRDWLQPFKVTKKLGDPVRQTAANQPVNAADSAKKETETVGRNPFLFWKNPAKKTAQAQAAPKPAETNAAPLQFVVPSPSSSTAENTTTTTAEPAAAAPSPVVTTPSSNPAQPSPQAPLQAPAPVRPADAPAAPVARLRSVESGGLSAIPANAGGGN